jgi:DNA/RNA-binding domain of Phe-tRNA-synthetase-like protein
MLNITASDTWRRLHHGAIIGLLELSSIQNSHPSAGLNQLKREVEARLRARYQGFTRQDFLSLPVMAAYDRYYASFNKTYHVQLQLESLVLKGKVLPDVSPLVDANFIAEVETLVLTAGHDVTKLIEPVTIDSSQEGDEMTQMNGTTRAIRAGDMVMRDAKGISCSIIYGQDARSPISPHTSQALYVAYAPDGVPVENVDAQLRHIEENVRLFSEACIVDQRRLITAG